MHTDDGTHLIGVRRRDASGAQLARPTRFADPFGGGPRLAGSISDVDVATEADDITEAEIGKIYRGKVVTVKEFGAFVEFLPGKDGLVHISELANFRVKRTEDIVKEGDEITVKCLGVDEKGRVRLSRKAAMEDRDKEAAAAAAPAPAPQA